MTVRANIFRPLSMETEAKEEVLAPVDRSALGWNQACLSSYINYALNTPTPTWS